MKPIFIDPNAQKEKIGQRDTGWRHQIYTIIFEADTRAGKLFDLSILFLIILSLALLMAESVESLNAQFGNVFRIMEWVLTAIFTLEYILRLLCIKRPMVYAKSFFGVVDFLSILPTYLSFFLPGSHLLADIRILRLLRIFRILGLSAYTREYHSLILALKASFHKIAIFLSFVVFVTIILGTLMFLIEGKENGFSNIPTSVYWAVTTMTTVGYGDISPHTGFGRFVASIMMLLGWGTLAVPTGIVTVELGQAKRYKQEATTRTCPECLTEGHLPDAHYCMNCGHALPEYKTDGS